MEMDELFEPAEVPVVKDDNLSLVPRGGFKFGQLHILYGSSNVGKSLITKKQYEEMVKKVHSRCNCFKNKK